MSRSNVPEAESEPAGRARAGGERPKSTTWLGSLPGSRTVRRVAVAVVGVIVCLIGVVMLPLPGPGWLVIFAGLGILATEFVWADRLLGRARAFIRIWTRWVLRQRPWVRGLVGLGCLAIVACGVYLGWRVSFGS